MLKISEFFEFSSENSWILKKNFDRTLMWKVRLVRSLADRTFQLRQSPPAGPAVYGLLPHAARAAVPGWPDGVSLWFITPNDELMIVLMNFFIDVEHSFRKWQPTLADFLHFLETSAKIQYPLWSADFCGSANKIGKTFGEISKHLPTGLEFD